MKKIILALLLILILGGMSLKLTETYKSSLVDFSETIFPNIEEGSYSITHIVQNKSEDDIASEAPSSGNLKLSLKPGERFEGTVGVKNHNIAANFILQSKDFKVVNDETASEIEEEKQEEKVPLLEFDKDEFYMETGLFEFKDFVVIVPKDIAPGKYITALEAYPPELFAEKQADLAYIFTVSANIEVEVTDSPVEYEYEKRISNPRSKALNKVYMQARIMLAALFGGIAFITLLLALKNKK